MGRVDAGGGGGVKGGGREGGGKGGGLAVTEAAKSCHTLKFICLSQLSSEADKLQQLFRHCNTFQHVCMAIDCCLGILTVLESLAGCGTLGTQQPLAEIYISSRGLFLGTAPKFDIH